MMRSSPYAFGCAVLCLAAGLAGFAAAAEAQAAERRISFNRDVRPILSENCFACHGPDRANQQAGLRLDERAAATAELDSGARAIVPEDLAASELIARITADDPDTVMPPPAAKIGRLSAEQVATLKRWIAEGAVYEPHWTFIPPAKPAVPTGPRVHPIDRLVGEKLTARGLSLAPEADRVTLVRRVTFDLTGLPPTPQEVAAFVADESPDAYEKLLDRLLASPRYGERMAADWMDIARYSDSYGFQVDRERPDMWPWRDWVIRAFNDNLAWDRFVTWQVAGDLLPDAGEEQILATAFNRLHQQESEGGSVEEEYRVNHVNDRTTTFGTAFLGLTLECCRCHDHKFDPLSQREYYQLFAFFDDIDEAGLYSYFTAAVPTPKLRLTDAATRDALAKAEGSCQAAAAAAERAVDGARARVAAWIGGANAADPVFTAIDDAGRLRGEIVRYAFDERDADGRFANVAGAGPGDEDRRATAPEEITLAAGRAGRAIVLTGDHPVSTPVGNFPRSKPFTVAAWIHAAGPAERAVIFHRSRAWTDAGSRGYELLVDKGHLRWSLVHFWPGDAASVRTAEPLAIGRWVHVAVTSDGSGRSAGLRVFVDGRPAATEILRDCLTREITGGGGDTITIGERFRDHGFKGGLVDDFRVFDRALAPLEIRELVEPGAIAAALREKSDAEGIGDWFAAAIDETAVAKRRALEDARRHRDTLAEKPAEVMVMRELPQPRTAYVLERGDYDKRGAAVTPGTPSVLPPFPADQPRNRLGLARWLTDPEHPLLARVTVNRLWQALFGSGLVQSPEDLGSQSTRPEHPDVLDLLAWRFSHPPAAGGLGWDMKALVKTIMMSQTYRQRSIADAKTMADDPLNTWLARGPRHRLPAEMIRDGILAASGLLVEHVGGPPVKTYDVPESFKPAPADEGPALYRRSLYTFWRRSGPAPVLETFDVPKRVVCVAKRDTTNTPLHAFVLLNGPQFVEAARVLAERLLAEHGAADAALERAFELLTSAAPDAAQRRILREMHAAQAAWYAARPDEAAKLLAVGQAKPRAGLAASDVAAAAAVVNALMNYDGCVVKR
jgi:mono/diheme cytochrome c family protein